MKIGILGTRGVPNAYGGFEQFAQYLAEGLLRNGHEVWVYNSHTHPYKSDRWNDIHIIHCNDPEHKIGTLGQFIYDFNCLMDARRREYDILLQLGYTSNSIWFPLWPRKPVNFINMDGLEWKRTKYSRITQLFLRNAEKWAARHGDRLIADSFAIQAYLKQKYGKDSVYIPYGAAIFENPDQRALEPWSLKPKEYYLLIARMEPENNVEMIIRGTLKSSQPYPLVIVGNTHNRFGQYLRKQYKRDTVLFLEGIYDQGALNNLRYFSALYFHGHSVGGTNPSLLESMACSCSIAAHDNPFNRAILNENAFYFNSEEDIRKILIESDRDPDLSESFIPKNREKIRDQYNWPAIVDAYEKVFTEALPA
jgi:glycosyltransferase involved in cell wall biosynthesis